MSLASLNAMQAQVHAEVRAVSPTREVIVCGLEMDGPWWILGKGSAGLVLPTLADGSPDPHLALEVHDYNPFTFASPPLSTFSWGTAEQVREVQQTFANLTAWAAARRPPPAPPLPIILGEYAVSHLQPNEKDRLLWYTAYTQAAEAAGLDAAVLWDDGGWFQTLNRTSMQWDQAVLKAIGLASLSTPDLFPEVVQDVPGRPPSTHFTAEVLVNSTWTPVYVFQTTSQPSIPSPHNGYFPLLENWTASWVSSQLPAGSPSLLLRVRRADGSPISTAVVHPASSGAQVLNISAAEGVVLALTRPGRLALDLDGELDATDTSQGYTGRPRHTFCWFVDPQLSPAQLPDPAQSSTLVVRPGEAWPTGLSPGHTVVFAPGVHHSPAPAAHGWTVYPLAAHTRYFLCAGAVVHGALVAGGSGAAWGQAGVVVGGYGVLSGEAMVRADSPDNASPQGILFLGVVNASITGLTLVDMPNHHIVAGQSQGNELLNVKVLGWRSNGDGAHVFASWRVADLFLRTQDDSLYLTCGGGCSAQFERITTWNDANGAAFLFSPGGGDAQAGVVLRDSDVIYSRASWFWWSGGSVFVQRGAAQGSVMSGVRVEHVRVEDPLPAFNPFRLNLFGGGSTASTLRDISFSHITVANFSVIRQDQSGRALPHGIPNTLFAAPGPGVNITNVAFTNVTIAGLPMLQLVADPSAFNLSSGSLFNVTVDGVQVGAQAAHPPVAAPAASAPLGFLSANGSTLLSGGAPYRFGGINLYWLGLDENEGGVHLPTPFRITDGLTTVAGILPGTVLRSHSLGISTGGTLSFEPAKGVFNASALAAADFAIAEAERLGLRVIVPLTDNWRYYHGGKHNFVEWCGQSSEELFYTDACAIAAFKEYIRQRLAHVNPYTGRAAADEPAIAMWETGNELTSPTAWTADITAYIKSLDSNHLVLDGNSPLNPEHLAIASVDCVSSHYYPPSAQQLAAAAAAAAAAGKVFLAGEYGWSGGMNASAATATCEAAGAACSGTAVWSLFPHRDDSGWVAHSDGFTLHYPGLESSSAAAEFQALQAHGAAMAGTPQPPLPPPLQPLLQAASTGALAWRGAALAVGYVVQAGAGAGGPWRTVSPPVGSPGAPSDATGTWAVPGGLLQAGQWVRMGALGAQGEAGAWSEAMQVGAAVE